MTAGSKAAHWHIDIAPAKFGLWLVLLTVWVFTGAVSGLWYLGEGRLDPIAWVLILPFPVIVSWYMLQSLLANNGRLRLEPDGFWRILSGTQREFVHWDRVDRFGTGLFGDPVVTGMGVVVAEFSYVDEAGNPKTDRLANNLPYSGEDLARLMDYARRQAALNWPAPPASLADLAAAALDQEGETYQVDQ